MDRLPLVMKVLSVESSPEMVARFEREAQALSMLSSARHVVRIHRTGRCPDGSPYIVMERLAGEDLAKVLRRERRLEIRRAVEIAVQASMGLHACHAARVLHRDIKPGNLFLHHEAELGEVVKLIDFGISHLGMGPAITALNATSGTRRYMAPEQARGQDDERADQFSLAAVLFQMLTGELPWPAPKKEDGREHERLVAEGRFRRHRALLPDAPEELDAAIARALSPHPDDRFPSVFEFGRNLLPFASAEARALFRRYADNAKNAQPAIVHLPESQQQTVRRPVAVEASKSIELVQDNGQARAKRTLEGEYATVGSAVRAKGLSRRRAVGAVVGAVLLGLGGAWTFVRLGSVKEDRESSPTAGADSPLDSGSSRDIVASGPDAGSAQQVMAASDGPKDSKVAPRSPAIVGGPDDPDRKEEGRSATNGSAKTGKPGRHERSKAPSRSPQGTAILE